MATKNLHEQALEDVAELKKVAFENAKNVLVEAIVPKIKEMIEGQLGGAAPVVEMGAGMDGEEDQLQNQHAEMETLGGVGLPMGISGVGMQGGMPALSQIMPTVGEVGMYEEPNPEDLGLDLPVKVHDDGEEGEEEESEEGEEEEKHDKKHDKESGEKKDMDEATKLAAEAKEADEKKDDLDEVVNITQEDLRRAFQEVLKSELNEASVSKSFGEPVTPEDGGLMDKKSGEHQWKDETPPAAKDWTVKEAKHYVAHVTKENASLKSENTQLRKAYALLKQNLTEVHLFNSKLLHAQKLIRKAGLSGTKSSAVIEAFDRAQSVREVELIYKSLSESLTKIAGVVTEARDLKGPKASRTVKPSTTLLQEGADRESNEQFSRWELLAGIKQAVK